MTLFYLLVVIVQPAEVKDRTEVESQHFVRTDGSVNLVLTTRISHPQRGAPVTTDQVSVHLQCPAASAVRETYMTAQAPVFPVAPVSGAPQPMD